MTASGVTAEERLLEQAERHAAELDAIFAALADPIVVYDVEARIVRMNGAARALLACDEGRLALPFEERARISPFRRADGVAPAPDELPVRRALRGEAVSGELMRFEPPGEGNRWFSVSAAPIRSSSGEVIGAVANLADVTRLQELREGVEDLTRTVSHDLRTPLSTVLIQAQSLARLPGAGEDVLRRAGVIGTSARRMAAMIRDLADLTRLEAGRLELELRALALPGFVAELAGRLAGTLEVARVRFELPAALPEVRADPDRLERILVNLLSNALKYSPEDRPVKVTAAPCDGAVAIAVADEGPGIPADELPRLFERYWRSKRTSSHEGLGLGLFTARQLVEAHGGRIEVETAPERGTTFRVFLPAA